MVILLAASIADAYGTGDAYCWLRINGWFTGWLLPNRNSKIFSKLAYGKYCDCHSSYIVLFGFVAFLGSCFDVQIEGLQNSKGSSTLVGVPNQNQTHLFDQVVFVELLVEFPALVRSPSSFLVNLRLWLLEKFSVVYQGEKGLLEGRCC